MLCPPAQNLFAARGAKLVHVGEDVDLALGGEGIGAGQQAVEDGLPDVPVHVVAKVAGEVGVVVVDDEGGIAVDEEASRLHRGPGREDGVEVEGDADGLYDVARRGAQVRVGHAFAGRADHGEVLAAGVVSPAQGVVDEAHHEVRLPVAWRQVEHPFHAGGQGLPIGPHGVPGGEVELARDDGQARVDPLGPVRIEKRAVEVVSLGVEAVGARVVLRHHHEIGDAHPHPRAVDGDLAGARRVERGRAVEVADGVVETRGVDRHAPLARERVEAGPRRRGGDEKERERRHEQDSLRHDVPPDLFL